MASHVYLLMFLLAPVAADHHCKIVIVEQMNCVTQQKDCQNECKIELVEECRRVQPEECTTEYETKCTEDDSREKRSINAVLAPTRLLGIVHSLGLARGLGGLGAFGALGAKHLPGALLAAPVAVPLAGLGLAKLGVIKLAKLKALIVAKLLLKKKKLGFGGKVPLIALNGGSDPKDETCFEIPRTVCPYGQKTYSQTNDYHRKRREVSGAGCTTTVQRVCGSNPRIKRSLDEKNCSKVPVKQFCVKQQEEEAQCDLIEKEVCGSTKNCKEVEVCSPERIQQEICEDEQESDEDDSDEYGDV